MNEILKEARKRVNLMQRDIADALYISDKAYSKIETGVNQISPEHVSKLCELLNLNPISMAVNICELPENDQSLNVRLRVDVTDKMRQNHIEKLSKCKTEFEKYILQMTFDKSLDEDGRIYTIYRLTQDEWLILQFLCDRLHINVLSALDNYIRIITERKMNNYDNRFEFSGRSDATFDTEREVG